MHKLLRLETLLRGSRDLYTSSSQIGSTEAVVIRVIVMILLTIVVEIGKASKTICHIFRVWASMPFGSLLLLTIKIRDTTATGLRIGSRETTILVTMTI